MSYIGTQPNNVKKNTGIYNPNEILQLTKEGSWGGSLEHIETKTLSGAVSTLSFDTLKETKYSVHFITIENYVPDTNNRHLGLRFKVSGSADTGTNYQYSMERITASTASQLYSGNDSKIWLAYNCGTGTGQSLNGSFYVYDAGSQLNATAHDGTDVATNPLIVNTDATANVGVVCYEIRNDNNNYSQGLYKTRFAFIC